jgi:CubicO group peptidase (beta-lactamase class C family)
MSETISSVVFLFLIATIMSAQQIPRIDGTIIPAAELERHLADLREAANVHGLSVTIFTGEEVLFESALGSRNLDTGEPLQNTDVFYAASLSKPLFAYIVLRLVDAGTLDLDRPLVDYLDQPLGDYPFPEAYEGFGDLEADPRHRQITARMCLSYTSGLPNWRYLTPTGINFGRPLEIENDPGTFYSYSGEGIQLLQLVVEQVTGERLEALARRHAFEPFGMAMSSYLWRESFEGNYAVGHRKRKKVIERRKRDREYAAGSMETTPADYVRFLQAMLRGEGLSDTMYQKMLTPQIAITSERQFGPRRLKETDANRDIELSYGLGWGLYRTPHGRAVFKEGHLEGWEHYAIFYPDNGLGVLIMTNSSNGEAIFKELLEVAMGDRWLPWEWENYVPYDN